MLQSKQQGLLAKLWYFLMSISSVLSSKVWTLSSDWPNPVIKVCTVGCCFVWDSLISSVSELIVFLCRVLGVINTSGCPWGVTRTRGTKPKPHSQASYVIRVRCHHDVRSRDCQDDAGHLIVWCFGTFMVVPEFLLLRSLCGCVKIWNV